MSRFNALGAAGIRPLHRVQAGKTIFDHCASVGDSGRRAAHAVEAFRRRLQQPAPDIVGSIPSIVVVSATIAVEIGRTPLGCVSL